MRKTSGETDGDVLFNGVPGREIQNLLRRVTGYVTQEDIMQATLTVRETLMFTAELRLDPNAYTKRQREARVEKVMKDLGIDHRADMRIGNEEKRGLSGGEKKRVAIGVQLVTVGMALVCLYSFYVCVLLRSRFNGKRSEGGGGERVWAFMLLLSFVSLLCTLSFFALLFAHFCASTIWC